MNVFLLTSIVPSQVSGSSCSSSASLEDFNHLLAITAMLLSRLELAVQSHLFKLAGR